MQDYAQELFNLSRSEGNKTAVIEKLWAGDVAKYITELESTVNIQKRKLSEFMIENVLSTSDEDILQEVFYEYGNKDFIANKMRKIIKGAKNTNKEEKTVSSNEMQMKKDFAIKKLGEEEISTVCKFMDVDIKEFTKEELIKILSLQQRKWLESIGFKYEE